MTCTVLSARNTMGNKAGISTLKELTIYSGIIKSHPLHYGWKTALTGDKEYPESTQEHFPRLEDNRRTWALRKEWAQVRGNGIRDTVLPFRV